MSKSFRFSVILGIVAVIVYCLYPSARYYFGVPENIKQLAELSPEERLKQDDFEDFRDEVEKVDRLKQRIIGLGLDIKGGSYIVLQLDLEGLATQNDKTLDELTDEEKKDAIEQIIFIVQNRIDEFGVSDIILRRVGFEKIIIQIPGETQFDRIENIIQTAGNLQLKLVSEEGEEQLEYDPDTLEVENREELEANYDLAFLVEKNETGKRVPTRPVVLERGVELSGERIKNAGLDYDEYGGIVVSFELDGEGAKTFSEVTKNNIDRRLAIVLDNKRVYSMPTIRGQISGRGQIDGNFTANEAKDLSLILRSGSLPCEVRIVSKEVIGPKLGREALRRSMRAMAVGVAMVLFFMVLRYRFSGVVAALALLLNGVTILALLAPFRLSLSLPGMAGLLLTMGIAIDANVLIFERIREEIKTKQDLNLAYQGGYQKAFWSIFDANITTIIAAFILSAYGEGAIKGFATTLFIGVIVSMFTALFLTRFLFEIFFYINLDRKLAGLRKFWI